MLFYPYYEQCKWIILQHLKKNIKSYMCSIDGTIRVESRSESQRRDRSLISPAKLVCV